jgi:hypothetical protein
MKVTYPRIISIWEDGQKPERFTDASKAAEYWARAKAEEWVEKNKADPKYQRQHYGRTIVGNLVHDEGRVRYRKLKRRALVIFRKVLEVK